jgi:hypothetical protein
LTLLTGVHDAAEHFQREGVFKRQARGAGGSGSEVAVYLAPVTHGKQMDDAGGGVEGVDDAVVADA